MPEHALANGWRFDLGEFEAERVPDMALLGCRHRAVELARLAVMIGETVGADAQLAADLAAAFLRRKGAKAARRIFPGSRRIEAVGLIGHPARNRVHPAHAVALEIAHRTARPIDRQFVEICAAEPADLRVGIGEQPALQQRVVGEIEAGHEMARMEGCLLCFGEEIDGIAIQGHPSDNFDGDDLFRDDLGRVQHVEIEAVGLLLVEGLHAEFPDGKVAFGDCLEKVAPMKIGVGAVDLDRFVPHHRGRADGRAPMELDESRFPLVVD
jgi:hypothetical protein